MRKLSWYEAVLIAIVFATALIGFVFIRLARTSQGPSTEIRFERMPGYVGLWHA